MLALDGAPHHLLQQRRRRLAFARLRPSLRQRETGAVREKPGSDTIRQLHETGPQRQHGGVIT